MYICPLRLTRELNLNHLLMVKNITRIFTSHLFEHKTDIFKRVKMYVFDVAITEIS